MRLTSPTSTHPLNMSTNSPANSGRSSPSNLSLSGFRNRPRSANGLTATAPSSSSGPSSSRVGARTRFGRLTPGVHFQESSEENQGLLSSSNDNHGLQPNDPDETTLNSYDERGDFQDREFQSSNNGREDWSGDLDHGGKKRGLKRKNGWSWATLGLGGRSNEGRDMSRTVGFDDSGECSVLIVSCERRGERVGADRR